MLGLQRRCLPSSHSRVAGHGWQTGLRGRQKCSAGRALSLSVHTLPLGGKMNLTVPHEALSEAGKMAVKVGKALASTSISSQQTRYFCVTLV